MNKGFIITIMTAVAAISAQAEVTGGCYTMASLAAMEASPVTDKGDGVYVVNEDITIPAGCSFSIAGTTCLLMGDGVTFTLQGYADFSAPDSRVLVTRATDADSPRGIVVDYDSETDDVVRFANIDFEYVGLRNSAVHGFDVDNCTFRHATGVLSSMGALTLGNLGACFSITNSTFEYNEVPAIGCAANYACGITIDGCTFTDNNTANTNKPQLNLTVGGDHDITIKNCTLTGAGRNMVGGIAVGNLVMLPGANHVSIEGCTITGHRYGITGVGPMDMEIRDNNLVDNNHETNAMNGGSGISLSGYGLGLNAIVSGNHIENSLWGITIINCDDVNLGEVGNPASPGNNVFKDNGNGGVKYDLYNNQANNVYAQNNTWSVDEQTAEEIETVIFHKADDARLGEVIFMPARETVSLASVTTGGLVISGGVLMSESPVDVYNASGLRVAAGAVNPALSQFAPGAYVAVSGMHVLKFVVR